MSKWRERYRVHPAAEVFPMMSDDELDKLAQHIRANKLSTPITFFVPERMIGSDLAYVQANGVLADGRNRLEALERIGSSLAPAW
jgi:hypothetical protein